MEYTYENGIITVKGLKNYKISQIFDCGQCFRFNENPDGSWSGIAFAKYITLSQTDDMLTIHGITKNEFENNFRRFLCLDCDYDEIRADIARRFSGDKTMKEAMNLGEGIRILRQEPWECVCSFIISQNNNIPRIKKIIEEISRKFGEKIGDGKYAFPTARALREAGEEKIFECRTGFRAKYIYDAACKVESGECDLPLIEKMTTAQAIEYLEKIKGIGLKVASCALLFGFDKTDAFPVDVWMKRIIDEYYGGELDIPSLGKYAGIAQQYLFYYIRYKPSA